MTIDVGLKPEGHQERSPIAGAGALGRRCRTEALFGATQDSGGGAFVAWRTVQMGSGVMTGTRLVSGALALDHPE